jgi:hypothetical protein
MIYSSKFIEINSRYFKVDIAYPNNIMFSHSTYSNLLLNNLILNYQCCNEKKLNIIYIINLNKIYTFLKQFPRISSLLWIVTFNINITDFFL